MISYYYRNKKHKRVQVEKWFKKGSWIYVEDPTEEELEYLVEMFDLEDGLLRDALDEHEVPRLDIENGILYIFTRFATVEDKERVTSPILIAIKKNVIITVSPRPFPRLDKMLGEKHVFQTTDNITLFLKLFAQIIHTYNTQLAAISKRVHSSTAHLEKIKNRDIAYFITLENVLNDYTFGLVHTNTILANIISRKAIPLNEEIRDAIEDLSLYTNQLVQISNENLRTIVNIREAYSTILTNNLNQIIKLFTALTVILTVPTIIGSFYGMNVHLPFGDHPLAFVIILLFTLGVVGVLLIIFAKQDWL